MEKIQEIINNLIYEIDDNDELSERERRIVKEYLALLLDMYNISEGER